MLNHLLATGVQEALAQEKGERAGIVMSLRKTISNLKHTGDVEGRLRSELVQTQERLAQVAAALVRIGCLVARSSPSVVTVKRSCSRYA